MIPGFDLFRARALAGAVYSRGRCAGRIWVGRTCAYHRKHGGTEIRRQGNKETRRQGDKETRRRGGCEVGVICSNCTGRPTRRRTDCRSAAPAGVDATGWAIAGLAVAGLLWAARRWPRFARRAGGADLCGAMAGGTRCCPLPWRRPPPRQVCATRRNRPARRHAKSSARRPPIAILSLSDIRFDPGDLAELRAGQAGRLSADAVERLVRAAKQVEVIAPNLPLLYNLPAVDGYDGGLLPLVVMSSYRASSSRPSY